MKKILFLIFLFFGIIFGTEDNRLSLIQKIQQKALAADQFNLGQISSSELIDKLSKIDNIGRTPINDLPIEILFQIFSYLPKNELLKIRTLSQEFKTIGNDFLGFSNSNISIIDLPKDVLGEIFEHFPKDEYLTLYLVSKQFKNIINQKTNDIFNAFKTKLLNPQEIVATYQKYPRQSDIEWYVEIHKSRIKSKFIKDRKLPYNTFFKFFETKINEEKENIENTLCKKFAILYLKNQANIFLNDSVSIATFFSIPFSLGALVGILQNPLIIARLPLLLPLSLGTGATYSSLGTLYRFNYRNILYLLPQFKRH